MLRIGIIGDSKKVQPSIAQISQMENCSFEGFFDATNSLARGKQFSQLEELMDVSDAFYVMNPIHNSVHTEKLIRNQKHCLIESPFAPSSEAGSYFINLVREADVKIQISNPDRYNDAFHNTSPYFQNPVFIESNRLQTFSKETKDLSLVMNLMIHDIDIILNVVKSSVKSVSATGVSVVSKEADIINARIEFDNGCIANLTASRINPTATHKINFYQHNNFINVDYLNKKSTVYDLGSRAARIKNKEALNHVFTFDAAEQQSNLSELSFFVDSITNNQPGISMANCLTALEIAYVINDKVKADF